MDYYVAIHKFANGMNRRITIDIVHGRWWSSQIIIITVIKIISFCNDLYLFLIDNDKH